MSRSFATYRFVVPFLMLFFASFSVFATQTKPLDTLVQIEKYRQDAAKAISSQDFDVAIISLNKANKLVVQLKDTISETKVLLTTIDLHYQIQNYAKAAVDCKKVIALLQKGTDKNDLAKSI